MSARDGKGVHVHKELASIPDKARGGVVVVGAFDGLHKGHRTVIAAAAAVARRENCPLGVLIFDPSARRYFNPDAPPMRLMPPRLQEQELGALEVNNVFRKSFDRDIRQMSPQDFVEQILGNALQARCVCVGEDFRFGRDRAGDASDLRRLGENTGFRTLIVDNVGAGGERVSSTRIREHVRAGEMESAANLLGRPYMLDGTVEKGVGQGRTLGWATANMRTGEMLAPPFGVYAARAAIAGETQWRDGIAYHGKAPTMTPREPIMEMHLFDFDADLYDKNLRIALYGFIRPDKLFTDKEALRQAIANDIAGAIATLKTAGAATMPVPDA